MLKDPLERNLEDGHVMSGGDALDDLVAGNITAVAASSKRGIRLDGNIVGLGERDRVVVNFQDVVLDLVHSGHDFGCLEKGFKIAFPEVADTDGLQDALGVVVLQRRPSLGAIAQHRTVYEQQVDVVRLQLLQVCLHCRLRERAARDLGGDEDTPAVDACISHGFCNDALVPVDERRVNSTAAEVQPVRDDGVGLRALQTSRANGHHGHGNARRDVLQRDLDVRQRQRRPQECPRRARHVA
mmetsp:Transcript_23251/g.66088  ORF Transcript_23251/g.66088 Transcript_23251/m.66088 type:complete len:241 (-) Transcript_23251:81-803(-)